MKHLIHQLWGGFFLADDSLPHCFCLFDQAFTAEGVSLFGLVDNDSLLARRSLGTFAASIQVQEDLTIGFLRLGLWGLLS